MKKLGSILVTLVFLITLIGAVPSFAAAPTASSFTFADKENGNGTYSSGQAGYNGSSTAIKLAASGSVVKATIGTNNLDSYGFTADNSLVMTMRIKFNGAATSTYSLKANMNYTNTGHTWSVAGDASTGKYNFQDQTKGNIPLDGDKWYNFTTHFKGMYAWTYVFDEATGEQVGYKYSQTYTSAPTGRPFFLWSANTTENGLLIDDLKVYCVNTTDTFSYVADGSTAANSEIGEDGLITVKFDQPIIPAKTNFTVSGATVDSVAVKDFNTAIVKVSGLSLGQSYTLDFSNVKSAAGTALTGTSTLAFKTPAKTLFTQTYSSASVNTNKFLSTSEIWNGGQENGTYSLVDGYTAGTQGVMMSTTSIAAVSAHVKTYALSTYGMTDTTSLILTTRFKAEGTSTSNVTWLINPGNSTAAFGTINGGVDGKYFVDEEPIEAGRWYNMTVALHATGRNSMIINDATTGKLIVHKSSDALANQASKQFLIQTSGKCLAAGSTLTIADTNIYVVKNTDTVNLVSEGTTAAGTEIAPDGTVTLVFDKPVLSNKVTGTGASTVASKNNFTVDGADIGEIGVIDFNKVVVGFYNLDYLTDYVLDFSDIVYEGGAGLDSDSVKQIAFTVGADTENPVTAGKATYEGNAINFKLYSEAAQDVKLIAAFYQGTTLLGAETATQAATPEKADATITIDGTYEGADSIRIYGWNSALVPITAIKTITIE